MPELPELVQDLLDPQAYPEPPERVELRQTQISNVFLAGDLVYKIKKPVDFGFLDYTTLASRLTFCRKEVELNRRLCTHAYLGVVPVTRENGRTVVEGEGEAVEYAVKMRRLPQERMMDVLMARDAVSPDMVREVARKVADFHETSPVSDHGGTYWNLQVVSDTIENVMARDGLHIGELIPRDGYERVMRFMRGFLKDRAGLFEERVTGGRIRDCHADLHCEHICFCEDLCIFDCVEFSDRLRFIDIMADVGFLAMDLDRFGRQDLSSVFVDTYVERSGDQGVYPLLNFYKCYRAGTRYMVDCQQYDDPSISPEQRDKVAALARRYAELMISYVE